MACYVMGWRRLLHAAFSRYLLLTNVVVSGATEGIGDLLEQRAVERSSAREHDWPRTGRMMLVGLAFGPVDHYWYRFLDRYLPGRTAGIVAAKVMADMLVFGPTSIATFYLSESINATWVGVASLTRGSNIMAMAHLMSPTKGMCMLEGKSRDASVQEMKDKFLITYKVTCNSPIFSLIALCCSSMSGV